MNEEHDLVEIEAVGYKRGNTLFIGGEEYELLKTVTIPGGSTEIKALLDQARDEDLSVRLDDGSEFMLSAIDDFDHEITRTRRNEKLMALLDERARQTRTIPLDEVPVEDLAQFVGALGASSRTSARYGATKDHSSSETSLG